MYNYDNNIVCKGSVVYFYLAVYSMKYFKATLSQSISPRSFPSSKQSCSKLKNARDIFKRLCRR